MLWKGNICQLTNNDNDLISGTGSWMFCVDDFGKDSQMSPHNFLYYTDNRCFEVSVFLAWIIMTMQCPERERERAVNN